jgi:prepilin signal peptidase PulO-like enzyme (type II secretory pathway)
MPIAVFIIGFVLAIGVNFLADSLPRTRKLEFPACHACGAQRRARAWSGVSALFTGEVRCAYCDSSQRWRRVTVELALGLWSVWLFTNTASIKEFVLGLLVSSILLLVLVIDLEWRLILHVVTGPSAAIWLGVSLLDREADIAKIVIGGLVGFALVFLFYLFGILFARFMARLRGQELEEIAFGFGDVTLSGLIGLIVGWPGVVLALFSGIMLGGIFSLGYLALMMARRRYTAFIPIPYSPFLIIGAGLVYFGGRDLFLNLLGG